MNPAAAGDTAPAQATPAGAFTLAATGRDEYVSLSWTPAPVSGPPVRYYSYRRSNDEGSTWTRWSSLWARLPGYPADPLFYQVQNLTNDVEYLYVPKRAAHKLGAVDHSEAWMVGERKDMKIPDAAIDRERERAVTLRAGGCSFHHGLIQHRSGPNRTPTFRRGLATHYMTARSHWTGEGDQPSYHLLSGREYEGCV